MISVGRSRLTFLLCGLMEFCVSGGASYVPVSLHPAVFPVHLYINILASAKSFNLTVQR